MGHTEGRTAHTNACADWPQPCAITHLHAFLYIDVRKWDTRAPMHVHPFLPYPLGTYKVLTTASSSTKGDLHRSFLSALSPYFALTLPLPCPYCALTLPIHCSKRVLVNPYIALTLPLFFPYIALTLPLLCP